MTPSIFFHARFRGSNWRGAFYPAANWARGSGVDRAFCRAATKTWWRAFRPNEYPARGAGWWGTVWRADNAGRGRAFWRGSASWNAFFPDGEHVDWLGPGRHPGTGSVSLLSLSLSRVLALCACSAEGESLTVSLCCSWGEQEGCSTSRLLWEMLDWELEASVPWEPDLEVSSI